VLRLRAGWYGVRFPEGKGDFFSFIKRKTVCGAHTPTFRRTVETQSLVWTSQGMKLNALHIWRGYGRVEVYLHSLIHFHGVQRDFTHFTANDKYLNHSYKSRKPNRKNLNATGNILLKYLILGRIKDYLAETCCKWDPETSVFTFAIYKRKD